MASKPKDETPTEQPPAAPETTADDAAAPPAAKKPAVGITREELNAEARRQADELKAKAASGE